MTRAAWLLAWRGLADRPWRSAVLLLGYGVGVAVMIVLLSVGDALLLAARDRNLVAGGDLVLLPEGVDPAVLKVNGVTAFYFTIPNARVLARDVLGGPRFAGDVLAAAPQLSQRLMYARARGRIVPATASGGIPSLDRTARATRAVPGETDSAADRAWLDPAPGALLDRNDRFHRPPAGAQAWAEWDYFNFVDPATGVYGYLTLLADNGGRGAMLLRVRTPGRPPDDLALPARIGPRDLSTTSAAQRVGPGRVWIERGEYRITVDNPRVRVALRLLPDAGFALPPAVQREGEVVSGYVVPAVRGTLSGTIETARTHLRLADVPGYHDHNWGTWRGVTWDWGEASGPQGALLYAAIHVGEDTRAGAGGTPAAGGTALIGPDTGRSGPAGGRPAVLFLWMAGPASRGGLAGVFQVQSIAYDGWRPGPIVSGRRVRAPGRVMIVAGEGQDVIRVTIRVEDTLGNMPLENALASSTRSRTLAPDNLVLLQLRGRADLQGTLDGREIAWTGPGAAETFVRVGP